MSFGNDESGDGLAALFGGITPAAPTDEPAGDESPRRAARVAAEAEQQPSRDVPDPEGAPPRYAPYAPTPAAQQYPGLAPTAPPVYQPPAPAAYPPAGAATYEPPAAAPTTPAYEMPAPTSEPPAPVPETQAPPASPSYNLPAPAVAPSASPFGEPPAPRYPQSPDAAAPVPYDLPPPGAAAYAGPPTAGPPTAEPPTAGPPAAGAPAGPAYPPTAQYPAGLDPASGYPGEPAPPAAAGPSAAPSYSPPAPSYSPPAPSYSPPAGPGYTLPASDSSAAPPRAEPTPLDEPPAYAAPAASAGYPPVPSPISPAAPAPAGRPDENPVVLSQPAVPATVFPPGPLLPSSTPAVETPEDLERSTAVEKVGLALAVIAGPIGLIVAIVNAARSARRRGWLIGVVRASLVLGVLSSIAAGIAAYVLWNLRVDQLAHAETAAASAAFCAAAEADPAMVTPPTLGWPAPGPSVGESLTTMQAWTDRWTTLSGSSPAELRTGIDLLAETGQTIVDSVAQARVVDDAANQAQIASAASRSGVAAWYSTYCVAP